MSAEHYDLNKPGVGLKSPRIGATEVVLAAVASAAYAGLGILGALFTFAPGGVTLFYLPAIFIYPAAIWFGVWGAVGGFFGTLLFAPYFGYGFLPAVPIGLADMLSPLIIGLLVRALLKGDLSLHNKRSYLLYVPIVCVGAFVEAVVGELVLVAVGLTTMGAVPYGGWIWWIGDVSGGVLFAPVLLRALTPFLRRSGLSGGSFFSSRQGATVIQA